MSVFVATAITMGSVGACVCGIYYLARLFLTKSAAWANTKPDL